MSAGYTHGPQIANDISINRIVYRLSEYRPLLMLYRSRNTNMPIPTIAAIMMWQRLSRHIMTTIGIAERFFLCSTSRQTKKNKYGSRMAIVIRGRLPSTKKILILSGTKNHSSAKNVPSTILRYIMPQRSHPIPPTITEKTTKSRYDRRTSPPAISCRKASR